jgi:hypothetical protein
VLPKKDEDIKNTDGGPYDYGDDGEDDGEDYPLRAKKKLTKKAKDKQKAALNQMLGALEVMINGLGSNLPANEQKELNEAIEEAKKGNFKPLDDFIKKQKGKPATKTLTDLLDAFKKAAELNQDVNKGKPLDDQKLKDLEKAINALPQLPPGMKKQLMDGLAEIIKWNDILKLLPPVGPGGPGFPGWPGFPGGPGFPGFPGYPVGGYPGYPGYPVGPPPIVPGPPIPDATGSGASGVVVLRNLKDNGATVSYVLSDRHPYDMKAGEYQTLKLTSKDHWVVSFDRGGSFGTARYKVTLGTYKFIVTDKGWDLVQKEFKVTIDNSNLEGDFSYLVDGQQATVKAKQALIPRRTAWICFPRGWAKSPHVSFNAACLRISGRADADHSAPPALFVFSPTQRSSLCCWLALFSNHTGPPHFPVTTTSRSPSPSRSTTGMFIPDPIPWL